MSRRLPACETPPFEGDALTPDNDETPELAQVLQELDDARAEIVRLKLEVWELRDQQIEAVASEQQLDFLIRENEKLTYLLRRPWSVAKISAKYFSEKVSRRVISKRTSMDME